MSKRRTDDATLIEALRILSRTIKDGDGVIPACLAEAAARLETLVEERRSITTLLQKIESLEAENERLREERRWVPVGERLPPFGADVLTLSFFSDGVPLVCIGWHNGQEWMHYTGRGPGLPVSHWQPLPPGPEANG